MSISYDSSKRIGTGSVIDVYEDGELVSSYTAVVFGDTNGDGWYDGTDAVTVSCIANGMLTREQVGEAVWSAADCNHDGVIDSADVGIINQAGVLLSNVDQTKSTSDLLETSSAYVEYLRLIDQNPTNQEKVTEPTAPTDNPTNEKINVFTWFINFIVKILNFLKIGLYPLH